MKPISTPILVVLAAVLGGVPAAGAQAAPFTLKSPDVAPGQRVPDEFVFDSWGCTGKNVSPALKWSGVPAGTKSLAVTVYDPDAPTGSGFWHWLAYNLPAGTTGLEQGAGSASAPKLPAGAVQGRNDYAINGYGGPCPPVGDKPHRYVFTVYALKVDKIDVAPDAPAAQVGFNLHANMIGKASFTALYGIKKK